MKEGGWAALAGAAAILVSLRVAAAPEPGTTAVETQWLKAIKANDLEAIVACYAPDAVLWGPGDPEARGTAAIIRSKSASPRMCRIMWSTREPFT